MNTVDIKLLKNYNFGDYRAGSVTKNTECSCRESRFWSQHLWSGSQPSVISNFKASDFLFADTKHACYAYTPMQEKHSYTWSKIKKYIFKICSFYYCVVFNFFIHFLINRPWLISYFAIRNNICYDHYYLCFSMDICFNFSQINN